MLQASKLDFFNDALLESIEETLEFVFGKYTASLIFNGLEKSGLSKDHIADNPEPFEFLLWSCLPRFEEPAPLLCQTVLQLLCRKLALSFDKEKAHHFARYVLELKHNFLDVSHQ